jgi:hypothetical protein
MVWSITKKGIVERMTISPDQAWAVPGPKRPPSPVKGVADPVSDFVKAGHWDVDAAQGEMIREFKKQHGMRSLANRADSLARGWGRDPHGGSRAVIRGSLRGRRGG